MATIIDALIVTLGLDSSGYKKGVKESDKERDNLVKKTKKGDKEVSDSEKAVDKQRERQAKENKKRNKEMVDGFARLRNETLAFLTLFTAGKGIVSFIKDSVSLTASMSRMSENVDVSVEKLSGFGYAMRQAGGSAEGMMSSIDRAAMAVASMHSGIANADVTGYFKAGGMDKNAFKDTESFIYAQADLLKQLNDIDPSDAMLKARQFMGLDTETFNLYKQGSQKLREQVANGAKVTGVTKQQGLEARKAEKDWAFLMTSLEKVGRSLLFEILPKLTKWVDDNKGKFSDWIESTVVAVKGVASAIDSVATAFKVVGNAIGKTIGFVVQLIEKLKEAAIGFEKLTGITKTSKDGAQPTGSKIVGAVGDFGATAARQANAVAEFFLPFLSPKASGSVGMGGMMNGLRGMYNSDDSYLYNNRSSSQVTNNNVTINAGKADAREVGNIVQQQLRPVGNSRMTAMAASGTR
jgi:hypothetical protein